MKHFGFGKIRTTFKHLHLATFQRKKIRLERTSEGLYFNLLFKGRKVKLTGGLGCSGPLSSQVLRISKDGDPDTSLGPVPGLQLSLLQFVTTSSLPLTAMSIIKWKTTANSPVQAIWVLFSVGFFGFVGVFGGRMGWLFFGWLFGLFVFFLSSLTNIGCFPSFPGT